MTTARRIDTADEALVLLLARLDTVPLEAQIVKVDVWLNVRARAGWAYSFRALTTYSSAPTYDDPSRSIDREEVLSRRRLLALQAWHDRRDINAGIGYDVEVDHAGT